MKIIDALSWKFPQAEMAVDGEKIVRWNDKSPQPSEVDVESIRRERISFLADESYKKKRAAEYPPIEDQLDAIWKGGEEFEQMRSRVLAVKDKYPKPEGVR